VASSPAPIRTIDDLIDDLSSQGIERGSAIFKIIRGIENGEIEVLDPHPEPMQPNQVLHWLVKFLQSWAGAQPGTRLPIFLMGVPEYLKRLRFRVSEKENSARAGAGRPETADWSEARLYAFSQFDKRGDPEEADQAKDWRSKTDVAKAVLEYFEKRALKGGEKPPDISTVRRRVPGWLKEYRAARK
jgi:hypothetical protein